MPWGIHWDATGLQRRPFFNIHIGSGIRIHGGIPFVPQDPSPKQREKREKRENRKKNMKNVNN